ncbi:MAG: septum formation protein Maf [Myxococcales bacterium]|jgi:septum formation protein|nr:septum formation protein Maf [Myxococcales bacterium]
MIGAHRPLVLGSQSPRRFDILSGLGIPLRVRPADVDETRREGESAVRYVERVTTAKLEAVGRELAVEREGDIGGVLTADTTVVVDGDVLGKPMDVADAVRLLGRIAGRAHQVLTCYAIGTPDAPGRVAALRTVESRVFMRGASLEELERYARTGEGLDKAGAYAVQGIGAFLVERIDGSYTNVVGLPACEVVVDLQRLGLLGAFPSSPSPNGSSLRGASPSEPPVGEPSGDESSAGASVSEHGAR